ncbi:hypothetical protein [Myxococcus sp. SDU36]|uniref:hypothetical protein n=1 Tax=Myxococcus sp. SDU36 TaxID=2831967 RepID=UPI0025439E7D|nr:hypothetical protein [Myxococcus sp. SDU36]WIG95618.1 hypothetical protein KGD87_34920 [Myxococcus sp. SDU36]
MPIAVSYATVNPSQTATFDFNGRSVLDFTVGIAYWKFCYDNDNFVHNLELTLATNKASASVVTAKVVGKLNDDSGHNLDTNNSSVVVCCVAVLDSTNSGVALDSAHGIPSNGQSPNITLPSTACAIHPTFLAGWKLEYNKQHQVAAVQFSTGITVNNTIANITATASMHDNSGNQATTAQVDAGLIAASTIEDGVRQTTLNDQRTSSTVSVDLGTPLSDAVVLLQDYQATFHKNQDNHVRTIGGGCAKWTVDGSIVRLESPKAFFTDDSGNVADDTKSSVSLVVIGIPKD